MKSLGQIAYEAYSDNLDWEEKGGQERVLWEQLPEENQLAWESAAQAIKESSWSD